MEVSATRSRERPDAIRRAAAFGILLVPAGAVAVWRKEP